MPWRGAIPDGGWTQRQVGMAVGQGAGGATLLGRRRECEALDHLLAEVVSGTSRVMVLRGDAGVGKSELLNYLSHRVAGWRVATAVGVESEMELAYSGLHQLCGPITSIGCPSRSVRRLRPCSGLTSALRPTGFWWGWRR